MSTNTTDLPKPILITNGAMNAHGRETKHIVVPTSMTGKTPVSPIKKTKLWGLLAIAITTVLTGAVSSVKAQTGVISNEVAKLLASDGAANDGFGVSVAISGATAIFGAPFDADNGSLPGSSYIFVRNANGVWTQQAKLLPFDGASNDHFGLSVAISGDSAIIGAPFHADNGSLSGSSYIFVRDANGLWTQQAKLLAPDGVDGDFFGNSVAIQGDTAVIGAFGDDDNGTNSGSMYVFVRDSNGAWSQQAKLLASDGSQRDFFGTPVVINGDTVLVASQRDDVACPTDVNCDSGSAYVFIRDSAGVWTQQAKLAAGGFEDHFGSSLAISGDSAIIGAVSSSITIIHSEAYIFVRNTAGLWTREIKLISPNDQNGSNIDGFGNSVAIEGDTAVVGAEFDDDACVGDLHCDSGSAFVFTRDAAGTWMQQDKLLASDGAALDDFGISVAISGATVVVGADRDDDNGSSSGSVYTFLVPHTSPADITGDGVVNAADLASLLTVWGTTGGQADLDGNGVVNASDLAFLLANWG